MEKNKLIIFLYILIAFGIYMVIGGIHGASGFRGDINLLDEGQFAAWISNAVNGKIIYKDIYIQYGPLQIVQLFFLFFLFGDTMFFVRLWTVLNTVLGILLAAILLYNLGIKKWLFWTGLIFISVLPGVSFRYWVGLLSILLFHRAIQRENKATSIIAGIILFFTFFQSTEVGIFAFLSTIPFLIWILIASTNIYKKMQLIILICIGFLIPTVALMVLGISQGWWNSYLQTTIEVLTTLSGNNLPNGQGLPYIYPLSNNILEPLGFLKFIFSKNMLFYWSLIILSVALSVGFIRLLVTKNKSNDFVIFSSVLFSLLVFYALIGRSGHYMLIVPFIILFSTFYNSIAFSSKKKSIPYVILKSFLLGFLILYFIRHASIYRFNFLSNFKIQDPVGNIERVAPLIISQKQADKITNIQKFMASESNQGDTIYVLNNVSAIYFLVNRANATRYDLPLLAGTVDKRFEIISQLKEKKPKFVIEDLDTWAVDGISDRMRQPEIFEFVEANYKKYKKIGSFIIYKRNE